ncbi:MAG: hypothetical protein IT423_00385, partial [Pirellulaceae bacterium]|nr:hypothetical protein [Pirellulaceae bacterium]
MAEHRTPKNGSLWALLGLTALTLAAFVLATIPLVTRVLGQTPASDIQPPGQVEDEAIQSLKVVLSVSSAGDNLDEPLALDLGLGFPLWLHRLGRVEQPHAPFGAVSQVGHEAHEVVAGSQATFEYSLDGPAGLDTLHATPQLLTGLRLSDISRVGFCSRADHRWILSSYKLHVNGKLFAGREIDNGHGRGRQDA